MIIGLTGGIGTGKSSAVEYFIKYGAIVIDADKISKNVTDSKEIIEKIEKEFGKEYINNGKIERKKLRKHVFSNKEELVKLNNITHPVIIEKIKNEIEKNRNKKLVIVDVPLLFETGLEVIVEKVILISAPFEVQLSRIIARDNIDYESALNAIKAQMPLKEKIKKADFIIENGGTKEELADKIYDFISKI